MSENINFELKKIGDISIFKLNEKRFDSQIAGLVKGELTILLHTDDCRKLIINLSDVEYCDSSGLSAILLAYRILQSEEGQIRLASPTRNVRKLIEISQLDRILPICETLEEAIADFSN
ncbi:MAG: anti-sigma factor antagonist [Ignavibacteriae bacterium HGW-Ignavibacteriae-2]|jgi:anti-anti-sigma factor|nr:STAS domain-containing protein [Bacteroidota bacterium]PKL87861.1 MAG: anti-sigma factor antagonist [Ignavibacteriae bacterium HGW-Ignavibacteriae-2]